MSARARSAGRPNRTGRTGRIGPADDPGRTGRTGRMSSADGAGSAAGTVRRWAGELLAHRDCGSVESTLWQAVAVLRVLSLIYVTALNVLDMSHVAHPGLAWACTAVMVGWTVVATAGYARPALRRWPLMTADLAVACLLVLATIWIEPAARIAAGEPTYPSTWVAAAVLAWAVRGGPFAGFVAAAVVAAADAVERGGAVTGVSDNVVLLVLAGTVAGYAARLARRTEVALAETVRVASATAERDRLAREIHDGVLQVLALVQRRGAEIGGAAVELGRLAGEQEDALRSLVASTPRQAGRGDLVDVRESLRALTRAPHRHLAAPATPVLLESAVAGELVAATTAALHNVDTHVGERAPAWLLVEDTGDAVVVTVRDEGPGVRPERLAEAAAAGRLGVAQSLRGRLAAVGGSVAITSEPGQGTEVELRVGR